MYSGIDVFGDKYFFYFEGYMIFLLLFLYGLAIALLNVYFELGIILWNTATFIFAGFFSLEHNAVQFGK